MEEQRLSTPQIINVNDNTIFVISSNHVIVM